MPMLIWVQSTILQQTPLSSVTTVLMAQWKPAASLGADYPYLLTVWARMS